MKNHEAYEMIGNRATELATVPSVQDKMLDISRKEGKEAAEKYLYLLAVATLFGI